MAKNAKVRQAELDKRVDLTRRYMLKGLTQAEEIHFQLQQIGIECTLRSVYRYMGLVKIRGIEAVRTREGLDKPIEELAHDLMEIIEEVSRELWKQYHAPIIYKAKCPHFSHHKGKDACGLEAEIALQFGQVKVMALKEIRQTAKEWLETMQSLGLAHKEPDKLQAVGKDGKPLEALPGAVDKEALSQEFTSFVKAKYMKPIGTLEGEVVNSSDQ